MPTRMGGPGAPDDMDQAHLTQAWLATDDDPAVRDERGQDVVLETCRTLSGIALPT